MLHLIKKPEYTQTRHEWIADQESMKLQNEIMKIYLAVVIPFIFFVFVFSGIIQYINRDTIYKMHDQICQTTPKSLLCYNFKVLEDIDALAKEKNVPTRLVLGIMFAESSNFTNFNKPICKTYNNPYGIKGAMDDNWKVEWYKGKKWKGDANGCWLYKFESVQEATKSLLNTLSIGYKKCENSVTCIAYSYVGQAHVAEQSWIDRVNTYYF
jgi:hypothetical protein